MTEINSKAVVVLVFITTFALIVTLSVLYNYEIPFFTKAPANNCPTQSNYFSDSTEQFGSATSGKLFKGEKRRDFEGELLFQQIDLEAEYKKASKTLSKTLNFNNLNCEKWSVVTTIFEPSNAILKQLLIPNWCIVVVGDRKGPKTFEVKPKFNNYVFLDAEKQELLGEHFPLVAALPWNHFGRKNIGYLYATLLGAKIIWDFDDDNEYLGEPETFAISNIELINGSASDILNKHKSLQVYQSSSGSSKEIVYNPYPVFGILDTACWPRGFPLEYIKKSNTKGNIEVSLVTTPLANIGIIQSLANNDPDVDAIYRLTQPLPFSFDKFDQSAVKNNQLLVIPQQSYAPYNAQATLHFYNAIWSLLLPVTIHGRVSDIWRGYIYQRLAQELHLSLAFSNAIVVQFRNVHNYLADFQSEESLYKQSYKLVEQLQELSLTRVTTVPGKLEIIFCFLYEHGYIELQDLVLVQKWLSSLLLAGYQFPKVVGAFSSSSNKISGSGSTVKVVTNSSTVANTSGNRKRKVR